MELQLDHLVYFLNKENLIIYKLTIFETKEILRHFLRPVWFYNNDITNF